MATITTLKIMNKISTRQSLLILTVKTFLFVCAPGKQKIAPNFTEHKKIGKYKNKIT